MVVVVVVDVVLGAVQPSSLVLHSTVISQIFPRQLLPKLPKKLAF